MVDILIIHAYYLHISTQGVPEMTKSIAQQCLEADDPLSTARGKQGYMGHPQKDVLRFHFEDNSYVDFEMSYKLIAFGRIFEGGRLGDKL